ncbi:hypothetical protein BKA63DRAFT_567899 [Paraphoma chrysanthemicola]|nr:hypothetical protein BKA63DRAFT_567899 [Paraphoma chrysanthemicola]
MARYQRLRPAPVQIFPRRVRRQDPAASIAPEIPEAEEAEGPESPDSPGSSPGVVGAASEGDESESEDEVGEPPSPVESGAVAPSQPAPVPAQPAQSSIPASSRPVSPPAASRLVPALPSLSNPTGSAITSSSSATVPSETPSPPASPVFISFSSQGNLAAVPQITETPSPTTSTRPALTTTALSGFSSRVAQVSKPDETPSPTSPSFPTSTSSLPSSSSSSLLPAQSEFAGQEEPPRRSRPQEERTLITKGAAAAAITLSVLGALAIIVAAIIWYKRRKRRQLQYNQRLADDAFDPSNTGSLRAPETAHTTSAPLIFGGAADGGSHLTRSTERSTTLFGPGPYERPETVSTDRSQSRFPVAPPQPTPNPFADPPLNKAYDVLAGRPRSTTLTDRGSWIKNPFRDPESERFDPFGELQQKARQERRKYVEESRKQAELAREAELIREFETKERMGLGVPDGLAARKGSGVTIEGLGVLDRSGGSGYR